MTARLFRCALLAGALVLGAAGCSRDDPAAHLASAKTYMDKGEFSAAIVEIKNALAKTPDNGVARLMLAKALLEAGSPGAAETEVRKAIDLKHSPDEAYPVLARALEAQGEWKRLIADMPNAPVRNEAAKADLLASQAVAHLAMGQVDLAHGAIAEALKLQPKAIKPRLIRARAMAQAADVAGAMRVIDEILQDTPDNLDAMLVKADLAAASGQKGEAGKALQRAVELQPNNPAVRYGLVNAMIDTGQIDEAAKHRDMLKKLAPNDPRTFHADALVEFTRGNNQAAQEAIQKAVQAAPDYLPALYLSGVIDLKRGAYASAESSLQTLVARAPDEPNARRALAQAYLFQGNGIKAMETIEPALKRAPNDPALLRLAGEVQLALRNPSRSAQYFEKANAIDKGNVDSQVKLAQVRLAGGDSGKGMKELEALSAQQGAGESADYALVNAHLAKRDYDKALAAADVLVKKAPKAPTAYDIRARVLMAKGDLKGARAGFEKALAVDPAYTTALYNLARIDALERDFKSARKRFDQVLAKDKDALEALLGVAEILVAANAPAEEVTAAYQRAIAAKPGAVPPRLALISYQAQHGNIKGALTSAQAANASIPDSLMIVEALGSVQLAAGETNQAVETFKRLVVLSSQNPGTLVRLADAQARNKDYQGSLASLRSALTASPENSIIVLGMATVYQQAGQVEAGLADAKAMQRDNATRAAGQELEGELLARLGRHAEAEALYRGAITTQPNSFSAMRLHSILLAAGKPEAATTEAAKWLKDNPKDFTMRFYLAQNSLAAKDYKAADAYLRGALELQPDNPTVLNNLAYAQMELRDPKALVNAERAYLLAPMNAEIVNTYGAALVQNGKVAQGLDFLRRSVDLAPKDAGKRLELGKAMLKTGDKTGARKELEIVAKTEPSPAQAEAAQLLKTL